MGAKWDEAPLWAYHHAIDACGVRVWHQHKPRALGKINEWASSGFHAIYGRIIDMTGIDWRETLERRPRPTETPATDSAYSVPGAESTIKLTDIVPQSWGHGMYAPNWNKAPDWARWFTVDNDGTAVFHEQQPWCGEWGWYSDGKYTILMGLVNYEHELAEERRWFRFAWPRIKYRPTAKHADNYEPPTKPRAFTKTL